MRSSVFKIMVCILSIALMCPTGSCQGCADDRREVAAVRAVRAQSNSDLPLQATLVPGLTDDVITLATKGLARTLGAEVPNVSFYRVAPSSYQLKDNKVVSETVELDNYSEWLVAIDRRNDETYSLEGSADPIAEFNRLAKDLHFQVNDASAALDVFDFFLKTARGQQFRSQVVGDEMRLESVALEDFRLRFPTAKRRAAFSSWWAGVSASTKNALLPPTASPVKKGFEVRYSFYSQGNLSSRSLTVNSDGTVAEGDPLPPIHRARS
jgi:hypothetical protein